MGASHRAIFESLERASLLPRKIPVFSLAHLSLRNTILALRPLHFDARGASPPALTHKNLMKLEGKVHKNLIRSSPLDIGYKSNLEALLRIGMISSDKCCVFGGNKVLPFHDLCKQDVWLKGSESLQCI